MNITDQTLSEQLHQYNQLWLTGKYYLAIKATQELFNGSHTLSEAQEELLITSFSSNRIFAAQLESIEQDARLDLAKIRRIVEVGEHFDSDEVLLVLTIRHWLDTLVKLLKKMHDIDFALPFADIDFSIRQISRYVRMSKKSRQIFHKLYASISADK